ncbi:MAG: flagella basal body P-ring formation protein FlgA [Armatimonadota bacterium]
MMILFLLSTTWPLHIEGDGYFRLESSDRIVYAREGNFTVRGGLLVHESGHPLTPPIRVPNSLEGSPTFLPDGKVLARSGGKETAVGAIVLARFDSPVAADADGIIRTAQRPRIGQPGEQGFGVVRSSSATTSANASPKEGEFTYGFVLAEEVELSQAEIRVGDVARVVADQPRADAISRMVIGPAPAAGSLRVVTPVTIQGVLRAAGFDLRGVWFDGAARCTVKRKSRIVPAAEVEGFAARWALENLPTVGTVSPRGLGRDFVAAEGEIEYLVLASRELSDTVVLSVEARVGEERQFSTQVVLEKGKSVANTPTVRVGQTVRVTIVSNGVSVTTSGRVKSVSGSVVTVYIEETRATVAGEIQEDGTVEVRL